MTIKSVTYRKSTSMNVAPNIRASRLTRARWGARTAAMNQIPSHLKRPGAIYFSFSSHCWHTVIAGPRCLATKSSQAFFQSSISGEAPPCSVSGGMIERSLHFSPCLTAHRFSFLRGGGGGHFAVGTKHSVMSGQSGSSLLSTDLVIEAVKGGGGGLLPDQWCHTFECDPHQIAPLLSLERSGALRSGIEGKVCFFFLFFCYKVGHSIIFLAIFHMRYGNTLLTHFMQRCGEQAGSSWNSFTVEPTRQPTWEIRQVLEQI